MIVCYGKQHELSLKFSIYYVIFTNQEHIETTYFVRLYENLSTQNYNLNIRPLNQYGALAKLAINIL